MVDPNQESFAKLIEKIETMEVGMLTTVDANGWLRSRPMATQKAEKGRLFFLTAEASPKQNEISNESRVNISYADPTNQMYVSVSGKASISRDEGHISEAWTESARRWFPQGPKDPGIALLTVEITQAEYWDMDRGTMERLMDSSASAQEIIAATDHGKLD